MAKSKVEGVVISHGISCSDSKRTEVWIYRDVLKGYAKPKSYRLTSSSAERIDQVFNYGTGRKGWKILAIYTYWNGVSLTWRNISLDEQGDNYVEENSG
jgi:hypothetical protein